MGEQTEAAIYNDLYVEKQQKCLNPMFIQKGARMQTCQWMRKCRPKDDFYSIFFP